ncbi:uncharacterized protein LOC124456592 [Xenia sp. Carnegie-2017]|uniref:uncharacterized protein LOC124456592 n=1 Tax=Xenia sp. Carnegie-2017 TaxID=2897299 RepID=UPI001F041E5C|nr:uncharacterized protein LOC124456592 [Xenia sp. Carnegie-2017]
MTFEAKHHYFTQLAHGMKNFKNLSKTLAIGHQRLQCYWLCEEDAYLKPVEETGSGSTIELKEISPEKYLSLSRICDFFTPETKVYMANWISIHGVKYHKRAALVYKQSILPCILIIEDIVIANGDAFFICKQCIH